MYIHASNIKYKYNIREFNIRSNKNDKISKHQTDVFQFSF